MFSTGILSLCVEGEGVLPWGQGVLALPPMVQLIHSHTHTKTCKRRIYVIQFNILLRWFPHMFFLYLVHYPVLHEHVLVLYFPAEDTFLLSFTSHPWTILRQISNNGSDFSSSKCSLRAMSCEIVGGSGHLILIVHSCRAQGKSCMNRGRPCMTLFHFFHFCLSLLKREAPPPPSTLQGSQPLLLTHSPHFPYRLAALDREEDIDDSLMVKYVVIQLFGNCMPTFIFAVNLSSSQRLGY